MQYDYDNHEIQAAEDGISLIKLEMIKFLLALNGGGLGISISTLSSSHRLMGINILIPGFFLLEIIVCGISLSIIQSLKEVRLYRLQGRPKTHFSIRIRRLLWKYSDIPSFIALLFFGIAVYRFIFVLQ